MSLAHLPHSPVPAPFQIGVRPLDPADWIVVDNGLPAYLDEKARLEAQAFSQIFMAEPETDAAQVEVLTALSAHLVIQFPEIYRRQGSQIAIVPAQRTVALMDETMPALQRAARLVQEDLVLMRRGSEHWRLAAASLSFPSSWRLADKFSRPMHEVHAPVPGFRAGSRNGQMIQRMFDNCRPGAPMIRWNWSLFGDDRLFHPEAGHADRPRFDDGVFLRVERQTFTRLPASGDLLFTIRIHVDPLHTLKTQPGGREVAAMLATQITALEPQQLAYKGLLRERALLLDRLGALSQI